MLSRPKPAKTLPTQHMPSTTSSRPILARELLDRSSQERTQFVQAEDLREEHLRLRSDALDQLPRFRPKCSPFDFRLKRPRTAVAEARAETPGTHHVLWDVLVANERVPLPLCLSI